MKLPFVVALLVWLLAGPGVTSVRAAETTPGDDTGRVVFTNASGLDLFLRVRPSAGEEACLDDGYRTVELPAESETEVALEGQEALCWCAVVRPRDSCAYPEAASGGEVVVVERTDGEG